MILSVVFRLLTGDDRHADTVNLRCHFVVICFAVFNMLREEVSDVISDSVAILFKGEVAGVEQVEFKMFQIPLVRVCACGREDLVICAPDDQRTRLVFAKIGLPTGVERGIAAVVVEQLKLNLRIAWPIQQPLGDVPIVGADRLLIANAVGVLPLRRAQGHDKAQRVFIRHIGLLVSGLNVLPKRVVEALVDGRAIFPICLDRFPEIVVDPFGVSVAVLDDE